jgi:dienelactone hydrolase
MKKSYTVLLLIVLSLGVLLFTRGELLALSIMSRSLTPQTLDNLSDKIGHAVKVVVPEGRGVGPFPVLIMLHGCGGVRPGDSASWAALGADMGYIVALVDSNGPRGYDWQAAQDTVCDGSVLLGQERAADVLVGLGRVLDTQMADPDSVVLLGWSHGAWTGMDFMTMGPDHLPAGISSYDGPWPNVTAAVLYYPYCGLGALSRIRGWAAQPSVLALMGAKDETVDTAACTSLLEQMKADGLPAEMVIYPEANHSFDYIGRDPEKTWLRVDDAADAKQRVIKFLQAEIERWSQQQGS